MELTKDTLIKDVLAFGDPEAIVDVLQSYGMHCIGCALAHGETLEDAAAVHGVNPDEIIAKIKEVCGK